MLTRHFQNELISLPFKPWRQNNKIHLPYNELNLLSFTLTQTLLQIREAFRGKIQRIPQDDSHFTEFHASIKYILDGCWYALHLSVCTAGSLNILKTLLKERLQTEDVQNSMKERLKPETKKLSSFDTQQLLSISPFLIKMFFF